MIVPTDDPVKQLQYLLEGRYYRKSAALAADIGVSRQTIHAWLNGSKISKRHSANLDSLYREVYMDETI